MKKKMILITAFLFGGFAISLIIFILTNNDIIEILTISIGITFYHFAMRIAVGAIINSIMKNKGNYNNVWFREKFFEKKLYKLLCVRMWKKYIPTYSPDSFDVSKKNLKEIVGATCQAEIVHEVIMGFSLLPIALIPFLGGAVAFIVTSVFAMLIDFVFVILQRYNRPRLVKAMVRYNKLNSNREDLFQI